MFSRICRVTVGEQFSNELYVWVRFKYGGSSSDSQDYTMAKTTRTPSQTGHCPVVVCYARWISTVCVIVLVVTNALLLKLSKRFVAMPEGDEPQKTLDGFKATLSVQVPSTEHTFQLLHRGMIQTPITTGRAGIPLFSKRLWTTISENNTSPTVWALREWWWRTHLGVWRVIACTTGRQCTVNPRGHYDHLAHQATGTIPNKII